MATTPSTDLLCPTLIYNNIDHNNPYKCRPTKQSRNPKSFVFNLTAPQSYMQKYDQVQLVTTTRQPHVEIMTSVAMSVLSIKQLIFESLWEKETLVFLNVMELLATRWKQHLLRFLKSIIISSYTTQHPPHIILLNLLFFFYYYHDFFSINSSSYLIVVYNDIATTRKCP